jgi:aldehyde:ferredoxin oxidoreductase
MVQGYYRAHGYDAESGVPTRERLVALGLETVAAELETHGPYPRWDGPPLWPLERYPHGGRRA